MNEDKKCECSYDDVKNGGCECLNTDYDYPEPEDLENWESGTKLTDEDIPF